MTVRVQCFPSSLDFDTHTVAGPLPSLRWALSKLSQLMKILPRESMAASAESEMLNLLLVGKTLCVAQCLPPSSETEAQVLKLSSYATKTSLPRTASSSLSRPGGRFETICSGLQVSPKSVDLTTAISDFEFSRNEAQ